MSVTPPHRSPLPTPRRRQRRWEWVFSCCIRHWLYDMTSKPNIAICHVFAPCPTASLHVSLLYRHDSRHRRSGQPSVAPHGSAPPRCAQLKGALAITPAGGLQKNPRRNRRRKSQRDQRRCKPRLVLHPAAAKQQFKFKLTSSLCVPDVPSVSGSISHTSQDTRVHRMQARTAAPTEAPTMVRANSYSELRFHTQCCSLLLLRQP